MPLKKYTLLFIFPPKWAFTILIALTKIGFTVAFLDRKGMRRHPQWKNAIEKKILIQITQQPMKPFHSMGIAQAEHIITQLSNTREIRFLKKATDDKKADVIPKRLLAEKFLILFYALSTAKKLSHQSYVVSFEAIRLNQLCQKWGTAEKISIEKDAIIGADSSTLLATLRLISLSKKIIQTINRLIYLCYNILFTSKKTTPRAPQKIAISLGFPWQLKFNGPRAFHFLVDDQVLKKEDVLFCDEINISKNTLNEHRSHGWNFHEYYQNSTSILSKKQVLLLNSELKIIFNLWIKSAFASLDEISLSLIILGDEFISAIYLKQSTHTKVYVYTNKDYANQFAKNLALRYVGISSIWYPLFIGSPAIFDKTDSPHDKKEILWYGQNPTHMFLYSKAAADSHITHNQGTQHYHYHGPIFAELIINKILSHTTNDTPESKEHSLKISVFDTTYINSQICPTNYQHAITFLEDIYDLAQTFPMYGFNIKPSKPDSYFLSDTSLWASPKLGKKIVGNRKKLSTLHNVYLFSDNKDPIELIAESDVIITDGLSSPTADALSVGKKAFWYDPTHSHHGYPFDQAGFVAHGRNELKNKIQDLLNQPHEEYKTELRNNIYFKNFISPRINPGSLNKLRRTIKEETY
ncbi:hypothetical protein O4H49_16275 [Kiloniella laminariae]|uniref:Uncharacterized protein n=1 Tax=Kiloniella laminariae TaxID=454162 RepID=A0ABT4LMP6_9PROT|nr:hypothetical protein [Kiloniella laminariae]MCZ4282344.1 hypothetical protein [Kiloniella laminariae]